MHTHTHSRSQPLGNEGGKVQHIILVKSRRFMTHMEFSVHVKGVNISLYPDLVCVCVLRAITQLRACRRRSNAQQSFRGEASLLTASKPLQGFLRSPHVENSKLPLVIHDALH